MKVKVGPPDKELKLFIEYSLHEDGTLAEIAVDVAKEGELLRSLLSCFCDSVNMGLAKGVPLEDYVEQFTFTRFEPSGWVQHHDRLRQCTSVLDLVFRHLAVDILKDDDLAHVTPGL